MHLSVPGSILLLGEYAVLEEGGLGLAMAVDRRVHLDIRPATSLEINGAWQGKTVSWPRRGDSPLFAAVVDVVESWLGTSGGHAHARGRIDVDSSGFFTPDGRKTGLGSSAAIAAGLACALLQAAGIAADLRDAAAPGLAVRAHRQAQGGRGSGYDVLCSFHGGAGLFTGGGQPTWKPYRIPGDPAVCLFPGPAAVSTPDAVGRYEAWKTLNSRHAREFLSASNGALEDFLHASSLLDSARAFSTCRKIGVELGDAIGVPARLPAPGALDADWCKAVGAGNELGACLLMDNAARPPGSSVPADAPGSGHCVAGVGRAFGKLLLFGEHAAVHGCPAVGVSLPEATIARIEGDPAAEWLLQDIPTPDQTSVKAVLRHIEGLIPGLDDAGRRSVRIESGVARGAGFGSSAALCGALARALLSHAGGGEAPVEVAWQTAHAAERIFHGTPSGVDTGLSLLGGTCAFEPRPPALPLWSRIAHAPLWLVVGAVPRDAACGELVAAVSGRVAAGDAAAVACIEALGDLAGEAAEALRSTSVGTAGAIGRMASRAQAALRRLGLSTPALDQALEAGRAAGATGGKLSGAGAGGAFYLVAADAGSAGAIAAGVQNECGSIGFTSPVRVVMLGSPA